MRIETLSRTTSNADALEMMQKLGLEAILAVDENRKPIRDVRVLKTFTGGRLIFDGNAAVQ